MAVRPSPAPLITAAVVGGLLLVTGVVLLLMPADDDVLGLGAPTEQAPTGEPTPGPTTEPTAEPTDQPAEDGAIAGVIPDDPSVAPGQPVSSQLPGLIDDRPMACGAGEPANVGEVKPRYPGGPLGVLEQGVDYAAVVQTSCGTVTIDLLQDDAPQTVNSFVFLADQGFFDGIEIFRNATSIGALQTGGGDNTNTWQIGYRLPDELDGAITEGYPVGSVAMANAGPDTGGSQFFVVYDETFEQAFQANRAYTVFGQVVEGLDVWQQIGAIGVDGERPIERTYIESVTIRRQ
ncbi:hypothetical protein BH23ACT9_BH23ACT9_25670 [soil metagenome]